MTTPRPRLRLVVLFGGRSAEHDVSRVTARHVLAAVDRSRYEVIPIGITREGEWLLAEGAARALAEDTPLPDDGLVVEGPALDPLPVVTGRSPAGVADPATTVVFPLLHGPMGEDGTVQGLLELADVPYVGCGVLASALTMDKGTAKDVAGAHGLAQARWITLHETACTDDRLAEAADELGLPLFVKPANMGSSIGVSRVGAVEGLRAAVDAALAYDEWLVLEEAITGREIEVAVLGNLDPRASVPGEIVPAAEFYDFDDKYVDGAAELLIPAPLDPDETATVRQLAVAAFRALRCEGMARVDFFYEAGGRGFLLNEINTIPGFTPISMYPKMWAASGLAYPALIDALVDLALERHARRRTKR